MAKRLNRGTARLHANRMAARISARQLAVNNLDQSLAAMLSVLTDPAASQWIKKALESAMLSRSISEAANDAEKLARLLREHASALQIVATGEHA